MRIVKDKGQLLWDSRDIFLVGSSPIRNLYANPFFKFEDARLFNIKIKNYQTTEDKFEGVNYRII